jgi:triphosphoribosyl-dephospho-CoA synthase
LRLRALASAPVVGENTGIMLKAELPPIEDLLRRACRLEVLARKPGNVHPEASFPDLTCDDFLRSADLVSPVLAAAPILGVGPAILDAVMRTQAILGRNTNLGIVLLLAPLAAVPPDRTLADGIASVLAATTVYDARFVYRAIRAATPGGTGRVTEQDLAAEPTLPLVDVMRLAAGRDRIAYQYAHDFGDLFDVAGPALLDWSRRTTDWETAVIGLHVSLMAAIPDTLIARKCGVALAEESARRARQVLDAGWPDSTAGHLRCRELDAWLRADGNRRNPGTTADLVAATLFAALRDGGLRIDAAG